jgi:hypothetical protein
MYVWNSQRIVRDPRRKGKIMSHYDGTKKLVPGRISPLKETRR